MVAIVTKADLVPQQRLAEQLVAVSELGREVVTEERAQRDARRRRRDAAPSAKGTGGRPAAQRTEDTPAGWAHVIPVSAADGFQMDEIAELLAEVREGGIARVRYAGALGDAQVERLRGALSRLYGRELKIVLDEDRTLVGGLRITVGDEVIEGSVAARLNELQERIRA